MLNRLGVDHKFDIQTDRRIDGWTNRLICLLTWALSHIGQVNGLKRHWNGECIYIAQEPLVNALPLG